MTSNASRDVRGAEHAFEARVRCEGEAVGAHVARLALRDEKGPLLREGRMLAAFSRLSSSKFWGLMKSKKDISTFVSLGPGSSPVPVQGLVHDRCLPLAACEEVHYTHP